MTIYLDTIHIYSISLCLSSVVFFLIRISKALISG